MSDKPNNYDYTPTKRQAKRLEKLNQKAKQLGFDSWSKLETAVINGNIVLSVATRPEEKRNLNMASLPPICSVVKKHQDENNGATDMKWFALHVKTCKECKKIMGAIGDVSQSIDEAMAPPPPPPNRNN